MAGRSYRSTLREEQAADTRRRIATAASELFAADGFAGTTIARLARKAGVAPQTVYATFGSKGAIMQELLMHVEQNADGPRWRAQINAEPDPHRKLRLFAEWNRNLFATNHALLAAALRNRDDPMVVELHRSGNASAREWMDDVVRALHRGGVLRPDLSPRAALDRAWILAGMEQYFRATDVCGLSGAEYVDWLTDMLTAQLLRAPE